MGSSWCSCLLSPIFSFLPQIRNFFNQTPIPTPPHISASPSPNPPASPPPPSDPSSSSSSSTSNEDRPLPTAKFEVFLSFRGPDTREGFTDFLYTFLVYHARIRVFRDDEELRKGEEIGPELLAAISDSKISIPILSRDYASSKWCLRELAEIVKSKKNATGQKKILPIFYHVEPHEVRRQTGCYADAFRGHEEHYDANTVQKWREALSEVGALKGWTLKESSISDGHEGSLAKEVTLVVLSELRDDYMLQIDEPIGIDNNVEEVMKLLKSGDNDVKIVGIHGMGGLGKTTIAMAIYNQLLADFQHRCFIADIRERYDSPMALQKELFSSILKRNDHIYNLHEGLNIMKNRVCKEKVLLILDDVDNKFHFNKVLGNREWFAAGSKIIVTTRDKKVLITLKVDGMYEPELLEPHHSLQLFCKHAFGEDSPPQHLAELSNEIVDTAAGLPLALKVIGSLLFCEEEPTWKNTLKQLRKIPADDVQERLKISFVALKPLQQQIFLDIACLFIGKDKDMVSYMWDDICDFNATIGINALVQKSLVKIGNNNEFKMHDQIRDMGKAIVLEENIVDPWERSRIWSNEDALDTLRRCKGTEKVKALCADFLGVPSGFDRCLTNQEFSKLSTLRYLNVNCAIITGDFDSNPLWTLRWLEWCYCPRSSSLTHLQLINLVILNLSWSDIGNDWDVWSEIKMAKKLKVLDLSYCRSLKTTPDLSAFQNLERLDLKACSSLVDIDPSIRNLKILRMLRISGSKIKKLPCDIGALEKLEELDASECDSLEGDVPVNIVRLTSLKSLILCSTKISGLPNGLCGLSCLQTLDLKNTKVHWLPELPSSLCKLRVPCNFPNLLDLVHLRELQFIYCHEHVDVPKDIWKLSKLEILSFRGTDISILPAEIGELSLLKQLEVSTSKNFQTLLRLPSSLNRLILKQSLLRHEPGIKTMPCISHLENLRELSLSLSKVMKIDGLGGLKCLVEFNIEECESLASLDGLEQLQPLKYLSISLCDALERLPNLSNLRKLQYFDCRDCQNLIGIQGFGQMKSLRKLRMSGCVALVELPDLSGLEMLKHLDLRNCKSLQQIEGLPALKSLETMNIGGCESIVKLPNLLQLGMLKGLYLNDCKNLCEIGSVGSSKSLEDLIVSRCIKLEALPDVSNLKNLKKLLMPDCIKLTKVPGLGELTSLRVLNMVRCLEFEKFPNLSGLKSLENMLICSCERVVEIKGLEELSSLRELDISGCQNLCEIEAFGNMKYLEGLYLSGCTKLEALPDISNQKNLRFLIMNDCIKLTRVLGLEELTSLEYLKLDGCKEFENFLDLSRLRNLKEIGMSSCERVLEIKGLEKLSSLKRLDISGCRLLKENIPQLPNSLINY